MKVWTLFLLSAAALAFNGCKDCDCDNTGTTADRSEINKDGTNGEGSTSVSVDNESASTRSGGGTSVNRSAGSGETQRVTGGVGDADAETGTLEKDAKGTEPAAKTPTKPGTISTRATRGAGTGTSQGQKVN